MTKSTLTLIAEYTEVNAHTEAYAMGTRALKLMTNEEEFLNQLEQIGNTFEIVLCDQLREGSMTFDLNAKRYVAYRLMLDVAKKILTTKEYNAFNNCF
jgi:hypothetical protein